MFFHLCACVLYKDHSLTALQPVSIGFENFFFALFSNSQRISPPFNQKVFATFAGKDFSQRP